VSISRLDANPARFSSAAQSVDPGGNRRVTVEMAATTMR